MSRSAVAVPHVSPAPSLLLLPTGSETPPTCEVPHFPPVRVRGGHGPLHRLVRHRRRALAAGLVVTAAALVAAGPHPDTGGPDTRRARGHPVAEPVREREDTRLVSAPVRIADADAVRLLGPGDRIDVVATGHGGTTGGSDSGADSDADGATVVARGARVAEVPEPVAGAAADGALVVVSVPRGTAHRLVDAATTARLAVTLC
ncbi:hypothetical protein [Streptomyces mayonensis]|uniref:hypothetical protein n=1 Tax=Streptomyces mayonensis TaxID=2750816 RepID=UPI0020A6C3AB|nr:hypothetical protein [Streptomyces sp. A108]